MRRWNLPYCHKNCKEKVQLMRFKFTQKELSIFVISFFEKLTNEDNLQKKNTWQ
jgi:hypothetical protein